MILRPSTSSGAQDERKQRQPLPAHAELVEARAARALRQAQGERGSLKLAGYAALFGRRDAGRDLIRPGAFARTLAARRDRLPLCWQHRPELRIGWIECVAEDARGLRVIASIDNPGGAAALALRRGAVTGLSFGYRAQGFVRDASGRELTDIDLFEVSLVTHPMQHAARVHLVV